MLLWIALLTPTPEAARLALEDGYEHFKARQFEAAAKSFERAWSLSPEPRFLLNLGVTWSEADGHCEQGFAAFERFFRACTDCPLAQEGERRHSALVVKCSWAVVVTSDPAGAQVEIDGQPVGRTPVEQSLRAGPHTVVARLDGHETVERQVEMRPNMGQTLMLSLPPIIEEAPPPIFVAPAAPPDRTWFWVATGTSVAGAVMGGTFGVLLNGDLEREAAAENFPDLNGARVDAKRSAVLLQVGVGLAVVGGVVAALLWEPGLRGHVDGSTVRTSGGWSAPTQGPR